MTIIYDPSRVHSFASSIIVFLLVVGTAFAAEQLNLCTTTIRIIHAFPSILAECNFDKRKFMDFFHFIPKKEKTNIRWSETNWQAK